MVWPLWILVIVLFKTIEFGDTQVIYEERGDKNDAIEKLTHKLTSNSVIMHLNKRIFKLEDELRVVKETYSRQEILGLKLLKDGHQNLTVQIANLKTRLTMTFENTKTMVNESFDKFVEKVTNSTIEDKRILQETIDKSERKLSEMVQNSSISMSTLENEITGKLKHVLQDVSKHKSDLQDKIENITTWIQKTDEKLELDELNDNLTTTLLEQKLENLLTEKLTLVDDVASVNKTLTMLKSNVIKTSNALQHQMSELTLNMSSLAEEIIKEQLDMFNFMANNTSNVMANEISLIKFSLNNATNTMNDLFQIRLNESESKLGLTVQNISSFLSTLEIEFKDNIENVRQDFFTDKNDNQELCKKMVNDSALFTLQLIKELEEKYSLSVENVTKTLLDDTNERLNKEELKNNLSLTSFEEKIDIFLDEKITLADDIAKTKLELSLLENRAFEKSKAIQSQILELTSNISSFAEEMKKEQHDLFALMTGNVSKQFANKLSSVMVSLSNMSIRIDNQNQLILQNMSVIEEFLLQAYERQMQLIAFNMSSKITDIESVLFTRLEKQGFETNKTIEHMTHLEDFNEEINTKLNETSNLLINVKSDLQQYRQRMDFMENNQKQLESYTNSTLENIQNTAANISIFKEAVYKTISSQIDGVTVSTRQLNQMTGNIQVLLKKATSFEQLYSSQNTRLSNIETRLSNTASTVTSMNSNLKMRYSGLIRLANGGRTYGRVEVHHNGVWGTVCDDNWDNNDAKVACRMMGLSGGTAKSTAHYGQGTGNIWLDNVDCTGYEPSLFACRHPAIGDHNCNHGEDAGVSCTI